ncbi:hypothetical protein [Mesorhizobium sp.]|uniref:hypothetical protein n=1 Tax=Mesorhizobium sp. TaxID=1871066 RepID=UPI000FE4057A|nr:hypothetical protein [Mesorhizobium sp.]RWJ96997.1 MAG: hypothetical protein EOR42_29405 [Mesorhizobium sp.]
MLKTLPAIDFLQLAGYANSQGAIGGLMGYWEDLPQQCPPATAADVAINEAYRLVGANPPEKEHFASYAKRGRPVPPTVDPCSWASCSFFTSIEHIRNMPSLPKIRDNGSSFVAKLSVPVGAGMSRKKGKHIDFWMFDTFDPVSATIKVEPI